LTQQEHWPPGVMMQLMIYIKYVLVDVQKKRKKSFVTFMTKLPVLQSEKTSQTTGAKVEIASTLPELSPQLVTQKLTKLTKLVPVDVQT